jgi:hypothetical protein
MTTFRIYADTEGTLTQVGRSLSSLSKALKHLAMVPQGEIREVLPSGREALYAIKTGVNRVSTVDGHTLTLPIHDGAHTLTLPIHDGALRAPHP